MRNYQMRDEDSFKPNKDSATCEHRRLMKEYELGTATGDYKCEDCGRMGYGSDWPEKERERKKSQ